MIQQFKNLSFLNIFLLLLVLYLLRIGLFLDLPKEINTGFLEFGHRILSENTTQPLLSPFANVVIAGLIVFMQAMLFNKIINLFNIVGKSTFLPALTYVLASSVFTPFLFLSPPLICNFFLLLILYKILASIKNPAVVSTMFDLGMIAAIATVFYLPFSLLTIILWIALLIFRPFNWREWTAIIMGFATIVLFLAVYYFWNNKLNSFYEIWRPLTTGFPVFIRIQLLDYIVLLPIGVGLVLGVFQLRENFYKSYILIRKTFQLLFFVFIIASISFYIKPDYRINHFLLCVIPVAALLAYYFLHASKKWFYESLFFLITGFIIYFQFV